MNAPENWQGRYSAERQMIGAKGSRLSFRAVWEAITHTDDASRPSVGFVSGQPGFGTSGFFVVREPKMRRPNSEGRNLLKKKLTTEEKWEKARKGVFSWEGWVMWLCLLLLWLPPNRGFFFLLKGGAIVGIAFVIVHSIGEEIRSRKEPRDGP